MSTMAPPMQQQSRGRAFSALVLGTRPAERSVDVVLLVVRIVLAWIFIYYGAGKLFGWFNGPGIHETSLFMADTAHLRPGGFFAVLGGLIELGGGIAVGIGLATRIAGLALFGDMVMAMITVTWTNGINSEKIPPGYELNLALAALAVVIALLGAGRFSIDGLVEQRFVTPGRSSD